MHLLEPECHGDPIDGGVLYFHHFGWDVLKVHNARGLRAGAGGNAAGAGTEGALRILDAGRHALNDHWLHQADPVCGRIAARRLHAEFEGDLVARKACQVDR